MIFSAVSFSISQRKFWKTVHRKREEWNKIIPAKESVTIPVSADTKIKLYTSNELSSHIYCGSFEWSEREWLRNEIKTGDVFFDVGANIGFFTLIAAEHCGSSGKVISFEPTHQTFQLLTENVMLNPHLKNITLFNSAVSDKEGEEKIYIPENGMDAWNSIAVKPDGKFTEEIVKTIVLDNLFLEKKIPVPTIIKIDIEGWELHALKGMKKILSEFHPVILMEFTASNLQAAGTSSNELAEFIFAAGYELFEYDPRYKRLVKVSDFSFEHKNLIAKKK